MKSTPHFHQQLDITNDLVWLSHVRALVYRGVMEGRFPDSLANRLQIAVDEAVTNVIVHGYEDADPGTATIEVVIDVTHERFRIDILDQGVPFDPASSTEIDMKAHVAAGHSGGLGIYLMNRIMDRVDYHTCLDGKNQLSLIKFIE